MWARAVQPGHHEGQPGWESARSVTVCWVVRLALTRWRYVQAEALTTFLDEVADAPVSDAVLPGKVGHRFAVLEAQHDGIQVRLTQPVTEPPGSFGAGKLMFVLQVSPTDRPEHSFQVAEQARSVRVEVEKVHTIGRTVFAERANDDRVLCLLGVQPPDPARRGFAPRTPPMARVWMLYERARGTLPDLSKRCGSGCRGWSWVMSDVMSPAGIWMPIRASYDFACGRRSEDRPVVTPNEGGRMAADLAWCPVLSGVVWNSHAGGWCVRGWRAGSRVTECGGSGLRD